MLLAPSVLAQSALDDIKARLESEGIAVIDYSTPEGQWGSLPSDWIDYLYDKGEGYGNLKDIANEFETDFIIGKNSLTALRRELAIVESEKTRETIESEIKKKDDEIEDLKEDIDDLEAEIKSGIGSIVNQASLPPPMGSGLSKEQGINLIFHEVDFYFNYSKWGRLPIRIISILEEAEFESLQEMVEIVGLDNLELRLSEITDLTLEPKLNPDDIDLIMDSIAILSSTGERQINEIARTIANTIKNLIAGLAVIWIIYAGARMVFAGGDENTITEQKRSIIYAGIGLVTILLMDRGIDYLYGPAGVVRTELVKDIGFTAEIYGLINFIKALIGTIAILFIIISGVRTIFAAGEEDQLTKQKKSLLWIGLGLILIAVDEIIVENFFIIPTKHSDQIRTSNVTSIINTVGSIFQFILGFVGLIAFGSLIYGAATMIMNYGNDEMVQKSKKIIQNAIIGIIVILSAYTIVATLVVFR